MTAAQARTTDSTPPGRPPSSDDRSAGSGEAEFAVRLENFEGPFDLLLTLISKHQLDVTEVALSVVTDEFITYIKHLQQASAETPEAANRQLEQTTSFLVVAATLLDLKAARLLPSGQVDDEEDLALLEARDLLFARLLQYKAYKEVASQLAQRFACEELRYPRAVGVDERFAHLLPEVLIGLGLDEFAALAARALEPKPVPVVSLEHLHAPTVSVVEEGRIVIERLRLEGQLSFRKLVADAPDVMTKVARFLSLLELYREGVISFEQLTPLGELTLRWTGGDQQVEISEEFDNPSQLPSDDPVPASQKAL